MPEVSVAKATIDVNWISAIGTLIQAVAAVAAYYVARSAKQIAEQRRDITEKQREIAEQQTEVLQTQINLALYQRRFDIYLSLMALIGTALRNGTLNNDDLTEFGGLLKKRGVLLMMN